MRAQGTVICALWVPQKRRAAECRVADSTPPALVPAEDGLQQCLQLVAAEWEK